VARVIDEFEKARRDKHKENATRSTFSTREARKIHVHSYTEREQKHVVRRKNAPAEGRRRRRRRRRMGKGKEEANVEEEEAERSTKIGLTF